METAIRRYDHGPYVLFMAFWVLEGEGFRETNRGMDVVKPQGDRFSPTPFHCTYMD